MSDTNTHISQNNKESNSGQPANGGEKIPKVKNPQQLERERARRRRRRHRQKLLNKLTSEVKETLPLNGKKLSPFEEPQKDNSVLKEQSEVTEKLQDKAEPSTSVLEEHQPKSGVESISLESPPSKLQEQLTEPALSDGSVQSVSPPETVLSSEPLGSKMASSIEEEPPPSPFDEIPQASSSSEPAVYEASSPFEDVPISQSLQQSQDKAEPIVEPLPPSPPTNFEPPPFQSVEPLVEPEAIVDSPASEISAYDLANEPSVVPEYPMYTAPVEQSYQQEQESQIIETTPVEPEHIQQEEEYQPIQENASEGLEREELEEKKSTVQLIGLQMVALVKKLLTAGGSLFKRIPQSLGKIGFAIRPKLLMGCIVVVVVGGGLYYFFMAGFSDKIIVSIKDFFTPKIPPKVEVVVHEEDIQAFGIRTALLFGDNEGSVHDRIPSSIQVINFFGFLREPAVKGETGITPLLYFGQLRDQSQQMNDYVEYVRNLEQLQSLYALDVCEMLNQTSQRDKALLQYLKDLQQAKDKSLEIVQTMGIQRDDLLVSYNSLSPDRAKYEADFFTSLEQLQAEKSDILLKGFVDITQKQTALKARINALNRLLTYYNTALARLNRRIEAVDKNRDALIQGIHVVDVPGANVDIIIRP